jgi:hypothetical protein
MKTTIDNNLRVLQVVYGHNQVFCNIYDLNSIMKELDLRAGYFTIYYFENTKPKKCSKKMLKSFFEGIHSKQEFYY